MNGEIQRENFLWGRSGKVPVTWKLLADRDRGLVLRTEATNGVNKAVIPTVDSSRLFVGCNAHTYLSLLHIRWSQAHI